MNIEVSEIFGPTFQGEGKFLGQQVIFLRTRRCNLKCAFCDSRFTWSEDDPGYQVYETLSVEEIAGRLEALATPSTEALVISGGEPTMWKRQLVGLISLLPEAWRIEIETNGTIPPGELAAYPKVHFNVSPKLESSGEANRTLARVKEKALRDLAELGRDGRAIFKFVALPETWERDREEIKEIQEKFDLTPIYIMPEGMTTERQLYSLKQIAEKVLAEGWRLTPRLHTLIWGSKRKV